jgi:outer membrane immunogenic protein
VSISTLARVAVGALLVSATSAFAADLPSRKVAPVAPVVAPAFSWTGFYLGADLGGAFGYSKGKGDSATLGVVSVPTLDVSGLVGGIHAGYNYQMGMFVLGAEADLWYNNLNANTYVLNGAGIMKTELGWQGSIRARGGVAVDRALFFVTAGVAIGDPSTSVTLVGNGATISGSDTRAGYTLGAGVEYAFTNNWIGKVEYRYTDFGTKTIGTIAVGADSVTFKNSVQSNTITAGVSYKF